MPLRQLYPNPNAESRPNNAARVDIIAVHGLNPRSRNDRDHAWDTWRKPSGLEGRLWLRDDLPQHVPQTRRYLTGIWEDSLIAQLSWKKRSPGLRESGSQISEEWRAPNWSWACNKGEVDFITFQGNTDVYFDPVEISVETVSSDEISLARSALLRVPLRLMPAKNARISKGRVGHLIVIDLRNLTCYFYPDFEPQEPSGKLYATPLFYDRKNLIVGLVLWVSDSSRHHFQRVGIFKTIGKERISEYDHLQKLRKNGSSPSEKAHIKKCLYETYDEDTSYYAFTIA
ncbi:hypothetical protein B0J14DRAFT_640925 [Halenospora varia]|nr:hypothetical protein B0J14DRAFT_640925 [Halenospora varia]